MEDYDFYEFARICKRFVESSYILKEAAQLCENDPIKQEMVKHIIPEFDELCRRSEGIMPLVERSYNENREFIIQEVKELTEKNLKIAEEIKEKLDCLTWN
jgi:hypothetical protein